MKIDAQLTPSDLASKPKMLWVLSAHKMRSIKRTYDVSKGSPVFTVKGEEISVQPPAQSVVVPEVGQI
ncbi:MAG TPA: hypothetical protein VL171_03805 [Verrucomicrobiae bacterium]|nr:hypothetical protein [Verrucomicrobiae bacterium]